MSNKKTTNPAAIRSREALSRAFVDLLTQRSFERITIEEITRRAGLSRQTFYTNFSRKEDILEHSLNELFSMFLSGLSGLPDTVEEMLRSYFLFWSEHQTFLSVLFDNHFSYVFTIDNTALFQKDFFPYAQKAARTPDEIPYLESYLSGLTFQMLRTWQQNGWNKTADQIAAMACDLLKGGRFL